MDESCVARGQGRRRRRSLVALRTRALILLAMDGLRVRECCNLDLAQVLADRGKLTIVSSFILRNNQAKGARGGEVHLSEATRDALRVYVREAVARSWIGVARGKRRAREPLFVGGRGFQGAVGHKRLSVRAAQHAWRAVQKHAGIATMYSFHSLRHDASSRLRAAGADVIELAQQMRWANLNHAARYAHELDAMSRRGELQKKAGKL